MEVINSKFKKVKSLCFGNSAIKACILEVCNSHKNSVILLGVDQSFEGTTILLRTFLLIILQLLNFLQLVDISLSDLFNYLRVILKNWLVNLHLHLSLHIFLLVPVDNLQPVVSLDSLPSTTFILFVKRLFESLAIIDKQSSVLHDLDIVVVFKTC